MEPIEATSGVEEQFEIRNYSPVEQSDLEKDPSVRKLTRELSRWADNLRSATGRGSMFDRGAFSPPNNVYDEMRTARTALDVDDIVSGVADITEAFAFQGSKWESTNADEADIFNQWAGKVNMDAVLRRMWREEYTLSQVVVAATWGWHEFTVRGQTGGKDEADDTDPTTDPAADPAAGVPPKPKQKRKRRKKYRLWAPENLAVLDATKVVPVGFTPMGPEKLAWCASEAEIGHWQDVAEGRTVDLHMETFFVGRYLPDAAEERRLQRMGVPTDKLLLMNPETVWRHTLTKGDYEAFPQLRMKSIFGHLDLKRQLMNADRASLIGAANYILLVRKGTDQRPAQQEEIENLRENYNFIAKMPVIISDHRLEIEIIAPKIDLTLQSEKYDVLDTRILMRLLGTLSLGARGQRNETNVTLSHAVARMMENRRHMMKRSIERELARSIVEHPNNQRPGGGQLIEREPNLVFMPRNVSLGFDAALLQAMLSLRTQREISRETILEQFGLDQATEAIRMEHEEEFFDDVFKTRIPFAANGVNQPGQQPGTGDTGDPTANGRQGGRPPGGGQPSGDTTKARPKTPEGNTKKGSA